MSATPDLSPAVRRAMERVDAASMNALRAATASNAAHLTNNEARVEVYRAALAEALSALELAYPLVEAAGAADNSDEEYAAMCQVCHQRSRLDPATDRNLHPHLSTCALIAWLKSTARLLGLPDAEGRE